jgi:hypothetical protein
LTISLLLYNGTAVAALGSPWEELYFCTGDREYNKYLALEHADKALARMNNWDAIHFMKDGGVAVQTANNFGELKAGHSTFESYSPITTNHLLHSLTGTRSLVYNDKGEFHEFILTTIELESMDEVYKSKRQRILLDKQLMVGSTTHFNIEETGDEMLYKEPYRCEAGTGNNRG